MNQSELPLPGRTTTSIVLSDTELDRTFQRLRDLGAAILSFQVTRATYTLNVILPPGATGRAIGRMAMNQHRQRRQHLVGNNADFSQTRNET